MTREEIQKYKAGDSSILLDSDQFVILVHDGLKSAIRIMWTHGRHELRISKTDNGDVIKTSEPINISKRNTLVLNPSHERHERLYKIEVDELKKRINLTELHDMSKYKTTLKILDTQ